MNHSHSKKWADVAVFENLANGELLVKQLQVQGFEARAYDDRIYRAFLFLRPPQVTYRIQVPMDQQPAAAEFIRSQQPAVLAHSLHCPDCGSLEVNYPQMTRRFILPTILLHAGILLRIVDHEAYCEHCHYTWRLAKREKPVLAKLKPASR